MVVIRITMTGQTIYPQSKAVTNHEAVRVEAQADSYEKAFEAVLAKLRDKSNVPPF